MLVLLASVPGIDTEDLHRGLLSRYGRRYFSTDYSDASSSSTNRLALHGERSQNYGGLCNQPPPLNRDYNGDPNIKALNRSGPLLTRHLWVTFVGSTTLRSSPFLCLRRGLAGNI